MSYVGKKCYWSDKVTHSKKLDGKYLGRCVKEGVHSLHKLPILWFKTPFMGFRWQFKTDVRLVK